MLGAVMFGHRAIPAGDRGDHQARRAGRQGAARLPAAPTCPRSSRPMLGIAEADLRAAYKITVKQERYAAVDAVKAKVMTALFPEGAEPRFDKEKVGVGLQGPAGQDRPLEHPRHRQPHRRPRPEDRPPDRLRGRRPAAHPRLGALHPRRDAGAGRRHARHRRGRADDRQPGGHLQGDLHAALQLPALLGRRGRPHGLARPPRDRPRQARLARHPPDAAGERTSSPTRSASSPRSPSRTARPRWRPSAAPRWR